MNCMETPYLPCIDWYRAWVRAALHGAPCPGAGEAPNRTAILGAWGEQTLTVPIEGGRRRLQQLPFWQLGVSEHGNWRHTHCHALTSAYGAYPYFPYFRDALEALYAVRHTSLASLGRLSHKLFADCSGIDGILRWLAVHPDAVPTGRPLPADLPGHICALDLLFRFGPESIFYLV